MSFCSSSFSLISIICFELHKTLNLLLQQCLPIFFCCWDFPGGGGLMFKCPRIVSVFQYNPTSCNVTQFIYICKLLYMFRVVSPPIIRSTHNCIYSIWYLSDRYCYLPLPRQVAVTVWQVPDAVDTVVCAPDDGWRYHPKHVEQFTDINKLCYVASCWIYTGCNRRNVQDFGRVFLRSYYTDITQNTYIQSSMVTEILAREV